MEGIMTNPDKAIIPEKTIIVVQHIQDGHYFPKGSEVFQDLCARVENFTERARKAGATIVHSVNTRPNLLIEKTGSALEEAQQSAGYRQGDLYVVNDGGDIEASPDFRGFFWDLCKKTNADHIMIAGAYFDACSRRAAETLQDALPGVSISVPVDLADRPSASDHPLYERAASDMQARGIDTKTPAYGLLANSSCQSHSGNQLSQRFQNETNPHKNRAHTEDINKTATQEDMRPVTKPNARNI